MGDRESTVALVGAGAVVGAWEPVIAAMKEQGFPDLVTREATNFAMARLVYVARIAEADGNQTKIGRHRNEVRAKLIEAKNAIASGLCDAETRGQLKVRPEFETVVRRLVLRTGTSVALVTTNWDRMVERAFKTISPDLAVFHLHGSASDPGGMYLPTEVVEEKYRSRAESVRLNNFRASLVRAITDATRLVIYGLGLSALDAELGQVLASGIHGSRVREVFIVDPNYTEVAERLATLMNDDGQEPHRAIRCYGPSDLDIEWRYSAADLMKERERLKAGTASI